MNLILAVIVLIFIVLAVVILAVIVLVVIIQRRTGTDESAALRVHATGCEPWTRLATATMAQGLVNITSPVVFSVPTSGGSR